VSSVRLDIVSEMAARVAKILKADGYNTNAGQLVFLGEAPTLGPSDAEEAIALVVRDDAVRHQGENVFTVLPVEVQALVKAGVPGPLVAIERVIADIKYAVEMVAGQQDHSLGGLLVPRGLERGTTRPLERDAGSEFVGASVEYRLSFAERWGGQ